MPFVDISSLTPAGAQAGAGSNPPANTVGTSSSAVPAASGAIQSAAQTSAPANPPVQAEQTNEVKPLPPVATLVHQLAPAVTPVAPVLPPLGDLEIEPTAQQNIQAVPAAVEEKGSPMVQNNPIDMVEQSSTPLPTAPIPPAVEVPQPAQQNAEPIEKDLKVIKGPEFAAPSPQVAPVGEAAAPAPTEAKLPPAYNGQTKTAEAQPVVVENNVSDAVTNKDWQLPRLQSDSPSLNGLAKPKPGDMPSRTPDSLTDKEYALKDHLQMALKLGASDILFSVGYRVTVRVNGSLRNIPSAVLTPEYTQRLAMELMDYRGIKVNARDALWDLDMSYALDDKRRFRVNVFKQKGAWGAVFRLIPTEIKSLSQLGLPETLLDLTRLPYGLILVTGPTGNGKSTTLASMLNHINMNSAQHMITIEDPIEYTYPMGKSIVEQREVSQDTQSWQTALKSILRQDPNVVLIGELRDYETMSAAMTIAETGHLVFGTLHTNSAAQTIDRIIDVFPEQQQSQVRSQLSATLQAIIAQRLVILNNNQGRRPAMELLICNDAVRSAIRDGKIHQIPNIIQTGADIGMMTLEKSLVTMVRQGLISAERAQEYTTRPEEIITLLSNT